MYGIVRELLMKNIEGIFKSIKLKEHKQDGKCYFDPIRYFLVQKTPEEEVRQKTIIFLQNKLGVPIERIRVEEPMCHVKKGLRGRADIVVYRDDKQEEPLMVIECKAPYIDVDCNMVLDQAVRYRNILGAEYIMLINGVNAVVYQFKNGRYKEIDKVPSYQELLKSKVKIIKQSKDKPYTFEDIKSKRLQNNFLDMGYIGEDSPKENYEFYLNLLNLLLLKKISSSNILNRIGVIEDCFRGFTFFGNRGGGTYQTWTRLFIAQDHEGKDQVLGISICDTAHTENDPHWGTSIGRTQLNISITNKETRHHSLQLNLDKFCEFDIDTNMVQVTHNGSITRGRDGALPRKDLIAYVQKRAPELVKANKIHLGCLDSSRLLEWRNPNVQSFIRNLLRYAVLRDGFRAEYKRK